MPIVTVEACGPDFSPDVFVLADHPGDAHAFAEGRLGILQTGYDSNDYAVAYRYLNGGKLSPEEEKAYAPAPQPIPNWTEMTPEQIGAIRAAQEKAEEESVPEYPWLHALEEYAPQNHAVVRNDQAPQRWGASLLYYNPDYPNCPRPAFLTAALTLASRAQTWGSQSPWLPDWVNAQNTVFSNCSMKSPALPAPAPPNSPALLQADRAYQIAAAQFYAGNYDQARQSFQAIASDQASPWHIWGNFLAARAQVRAAFAAGPRTDQWSDKVAGFDMPMMQRAQQMLQSLLAHHDPGLPRSAILHELNFVRLRTEPDQRLTEICAVLAGPAPDDNFDQDLKDLSYLIWKAPTHSSPPLFAWMAALRASNPADAVLAWKQTPSLPSLIAALMRTPPTDPSVPDLLNAAARIRPDSPAWETVMVHRVRLLTGLGRSDEARVLLDGFLPAMRQRPADSALNAFLAERMAVARTFPEFLDFAPRTVLQEDSEGWWYQRESCPPVPGEPYHKKPCLPDHPMEFDADAAAVLNHDPLQMLIETAHSPHLPPNLREEVAAAAWTRSVVLHDEASAAKLEPLLPASLHARSGDGIRFPAVLTILRNPGLRPYVEPGVSHLNNPGALDEFRDNWWCSDWSEQFSQNTKTARRAPSFLTVKQAQIGDAEYARIVALPCAPEFLGRRVLDYAKQHPTDPDLPEALALTVRATHYACLSWAKDQHQGPSENTAVSKAAFEMLHQRFPNSVWTTRTRFYY
jgi:hypothetical protein